MPRQGNGPNPGPNQGQSMLAPRPRTKEKPTNVRRWGGNPAQAQARVWSCSLSATWPHLALVVRSSVGASGAGVYSRNIPPKPTKPSLYKRRGAPLTHTHHTHLELHSCHTHFKDKMECIFLCVPRDQFTHKLTN
jgi:hypothetical protein